MVNYPFNNFIHKSGSKQWPSDDPNDSSCDTFICKKCDKIFKIQMYGAYHADGETFEKKAEEILINHLKIHNKGEGNE